MAAQQIEWGRHPGRARCSGGHRPTRSTPSPSAMPTRGFRVPGTRRRRRARGSSSRRSGSPGTPVTVAQWAAYAEETGARAIAGIDEHPVVGVTWAEASAFAAWIGSQLGEEVRLPTEDEWERAARGDDTREFPWGDEYVRGRANLFDLGLGTTTPVGSFPDGASAFGVLDMAGNVDEWTSTRYAPYPGAPDSVPTVEDWAADPHITRGGASATTSTWPALRAATRALRCRPPRGGHRVPARGLRRVIVATVQSA